MDSRTFASKPRSRPATSKLATSRLTSHSNGPGCVSSKSLMLKTIRRSGAANAPKFDRCASPHSCTCRSVRGAPARSAAIRYAPPRKNVNGETSIRPYRSGTSDGSRVCACSSSSSTGSLRPTDGSNAACDERGTSVRSALPRAARSITVGCGTARTAPAGSWPLRVGLCVAVPGSRCAVTASVGAELMASPSNGRASGPSAAGSLAGHHRDGLALEVDVGLAADVDRHAVDRAADERVRRFARVAVGDGVAAVAPDAQPVAGDRELARLRLDAPLADLHLAVEERQRADRHAGRILALLLEGGGQDQLLPGRHVLVGDDLLLEAPDEAVDVVQPVVLDVQGVAAEARAVREQDAVGARHVDVDDSADRVGAVAEVDRLGLGYVGDAGVVDVAVARR